MSSQTSPQSASTERAWLQPVLVVFTGWALLQSLLAWWRPPAPPPPPLPQRLQLEGQWLERRPAAKPVGALPDGNEVQRGADYSAPGSPRLVLRWIVRTSSGSGVRFDPDLLAAALIGPKANGVCRFYDPDSGRLIGSSSTTEGSKALMRHTNPDAWQRLQWAAGLRPWRVNRCLFVAVAKR